MYKLILLIALYLRLVAFVGAATSGVLPWNGTAHRNHIAERGLSGLPGFPLTTWPNGNVRSQSEIKLGPFDARPTLKS